MTKDMAIKELSESIQLIDENKYPVQEYREALVMAVQALKGYDIEQIRAEISIDLNNLEYNHDLTIDMNAGKYVGLKRALDVIDNYAK
jgi:hypothetical protein